MIQVSLDAKADSTERAVSFVYVRHLLLIFSFLYICVNLGYAQIARNFVEIHHKNRRRKMMSFIRFHWRKAWYRCDGGACCKYTPFERNYRVGLIFVLYN